MDSMSVPDNNSKTERILYPTLTEMGWVFTVAAWLFSALVFFSVKGAVGMAGVMLAIIPVIVAGWYFNTMGAVFTAVISVLLDIGLLQLSMPNSWKGVFEPTDLLGVFTLLLSALVVGQLSSLTRKQRARLREREAMEREQCTQTSFLSLLNRITRDALQADNLSSMIHVLAKQVSELFSADDCFISLWDDVHEAPFLSAAYGPHARIYRAIRFEPGASSPDTIVLKSGRYLAVEDIADSPYVHPKVKGALAGQSLLGLPLIVENKKLGVIILSFNEKRFSREEIAQGELAATQIALAITKIRLLEDAQRRLTELTGLHELSKIFGASNNIKHVYGLLTEKLASLIGAQKCFIALYDAQSAEMRAQAPNFGIGENTMVGLHFPASLAATLWVSSREDVFLANNPKDFPSRFKEISQVFGAKSMLVAPMRSESQLIGMVFAANKPEGFNQDDMRLMSIFAGQVTMVIQGTRLFEATQQQAKRQSALLQLSTRLAVQLDEKDICESLVEGLHEILGYDHIAMFMVDQENNRRVTKAFAGLWADSSVPCLETGQGLSERPLLDGQIHYTPDVSQEPSYVPGVGGSEVDVPIWIGERVSAVLTIESKRVHAFGQEDFDTLIAAANLVGLALTRAQLLISERRQFEELSVLHTIALAITEAICEDELLERVTQIIGENLYPDNFGVLLLNESADMLRLHSSYRLGEREQPIDIPLEKGIVGKVARSGEPFRIADVAQDPDYLNVDSRIQSELCVPLKAGKRLIGVVNAESAKLSAFSAADERLLVTIAGQLASAIERLRSTEAVSQQADELAHSNKLINVLVRIAARIGTTPNADGVMSLMGEELKQVGLNSAVALYIRDTQDLALRYSSLGSPMYDFFERILRRPLSGFVIPGERFLKVDRQLQPDRAQIINNAFTISKAILGNFPKAAFSQMMKLSGMTNDIPVGHLPLFVNEQALGYLWVWGKGLREADVQTLSIFANHVAITLENARLFAEVQRLAVTDDVTGIYNRRHAYVLGRGEFRRVHRYGRTMSALILDIDHFKDINDRFGHSCGDQALGAVAGVLRKGLRDFDVLGRYGGEEFIVFLPETDPSAAQKVGNRLRESVAKLRIPSNKGAAMVTVSIGVAGYEQDVPDLEALVNRADEALYAAKRSGRNRVVLYQSNAQASQ
jgi:diguanylate cyclase (GGDEF)-like protein